MNNDLISRSALLKKAVDVLEYDEGGWDYEFKAVPVGEVLKAPAVDAVPVDDMLGEMLNWAVRYSLGRMSYAVSDIVGYVMPLIPKLDKRTLSVMQRDIETAPSYGHECDKADWMRLLYAIREELKRRADNGNRDDA